MVRPKKQSKRISCNKRYKVIKKVKEHHRKVRKDEKQKSNSKRKPKDPGIPNSYPFKEQLLKQIQEKREKEAEERKKKKENASKESRKRKLQDLKKDAENRGREFDKKQLADRNQDSKSGSVETSRKSFYKEFKKVVDAADVVIEVLDARDPLGCRCLQLEEMVMSSGPNKKLLLLLNKIDLIPKDIVQEWLKYLRRELPTIAFKASTQTQRHKLARSKVSVEVASEDMLKTSACIGSNTLMKLLGNYCRNLDIKTAITVGIVGFPNVGKSSVINSLKRSRACSVGATPGMTRTMQEVQLDKYVKLLDSPGIVMATGSSDTQIILRNAVKVEQIEDPSVPVEAILKRCSKNQVMEKYCIADYKDTSEFLSLLSIRLGKLKKGGVPDTHAAARVLLQDWNSGKITFYTHPPERPIDTEHESAQVVPYLAAGFDLNAIAKEEADDMKGLLEALGSSLVLDPGKPGVMETEPIALSEDENASDADFDSQSVDRYEENENMAVTDGDAELQGMVVLAKKRKTQAAASEAKEKLAADAHEMGDNNNIQSNRNLKKAFKQKQKEERKRVAKLLEDDANRMKDDDAYDFAAVLP